MDVRALAERVTHRHHHFHEDSPNGGIGRMLRDSRLASREVFREWRGYHRRRLTVTDRRFGSVDQDGFTSERVLEGARAREMIASPESVEYPRDRKSVV